MISKHFTCKRKTLCTADAKLYDGPEGRNLQVHCELDLRTVETFTVMRSIMIIYQGIHTILEHKNIFF